MLLHAAPALELCRRYFLPRARSENFFAPPEELLHKPGRPAGMVYRYGPGASLSTQLRNSRVMRAVGTTYDATFIFELECTLCARKFSSHGAGADPININKAAANLHDVRVYAFSPTRPNRLLISGPPRLAEEVYASYPLLNGCRGWRRRRDRIVD